MSDAHLELTFEDCRKEERYQNLQRELKIASLKKMDRASDPSKSQFNSPTWPSMSSINADGLDTSCAMGAPSLQVSRVESEVVSSSTNLRKIFPPHRGKHFGRPPIATSSVKRFPVNNDKDRAMMPPPPSDLMFLNRKKLCNTNPMTKTQNEESNRQEMNVESANSSVKMLTENSSTDYQDSNSAAPSGSNDLKKYRVFTHWRVLLNDQGQLIIKGILECGKVARSKPILQRLASNKIKSVYNHIYILDGNIVDDRNELPDYICGKFHNGFPDDWENVYQLWKHYVAEGSPVLFRWPTPITDSDDDIHSEITDFVYITKNQCQEKSVPLKSGFNNVSSNVQSDNNQNLEKSKDEQVNKVVPAVQITNDKIDDSKHSMEPKDIKTNNENGMESSRGSHSTSSNTTSNLKSASYLYEIIREDKLRIILSNLGDKNCPPQYLDKFIELIDCLRYVLSYIPNTYHEQENRQNTSPARNQSQNCHKCNTSTLLYESQDMHREEQVNKITKRNESVNSTVEKRSQIETHQPQENCIQSKPLKPNDIEDESSDSDVYMGIPHVSLNHLIKSNPPRLTRYRQRKNRSRDGKDISREKLNQKQVKPVPNQQIQQYDSSVSIIEDEFDKTQQKKQKEHCSGRLFNEKKMIDYENSSSQRLSNSAKEISKFNSSEKQKPVIKSSEPIHFKVKIKHRLHDRNYANSDVSILEDEVLIKKQKLSNHRSDIVKNHQSKQNINNDLLDHPFLTYDSDKFPELKENDTPLQAQENIYGKINKQKSGIAKDGIEHNCTSSDRTKRPVNDIIGQTDPFGSKENPKVLTHWTPWVVYNDQRRTSLKFEGKLVNEAGHIIHRKFITDAISRRHSLKLVETVNNEYFLLDGDLNDTKHGIPKELIKQCRAGCPLKIHEFCEEWRKLKEDERVPTVDNEISNRASSKRELIVLATKLSPTKLMAPNDRQLRNSYRNRDNPNLRTSSTKSMRLNNNAHDAETIRRKSKKRLAIISSSSSSSEDNEPPNNYENMGSIQSSNENTQRDSHLIQTDSRTNVKILTESSYNVKLRRKRQKLDIEESYQETEDVKHNLRPKVSPKIPDSGLTWSLEKGQQFHDILSDDQISVLAK